MIPKERVILVVTLLLLLLLCAMSSHSSSSSSSAGAGFDPNALPWVLVNTRYTEDQKGRPLKEEDSVVTDNLVFTAEEISRFREKSEVRCPTYGCCPSCWAAGPVALVCAECNPPDRWPGMVYRCVKVDRGHGDVRWVDGRALARITGRPVKVPVADHRVKWIRTPDVELTEFDFRHLMGGKDHEAFGRLFV